MSITSATINRSSVTAVVLARRVKRGQGVKLKVTHPAWAAVRIMPIIPAGVLIDGSGYLGNSALKIGNHFRLLFLEVRGAVGPICFIGEFAATDTLLHPGGPPLKGIHRKRMTGRPNAKRMGGAEHLSLDTGVLLMRLMAGGDDFHLSRFPIAACGAGLRQDRLLRQ
jgi:hypothetical protein